MIEIIQEILQNLREIGHPHIPDPAALHSAYPSDSGAPTPDANAAILWTRRRLRAHREERPFEEPPPAPLDALLAGPSPWGDARTTRAQIALLEAWTDPDLAWRAAAHPDTHEKIRSRCAQTERDLVALQGARRLAQAGGAHRSEERLDALQLALQTSGQIQRRARPVPTPAVLLLCAEVVDELSAAARLEADKAEGPVPQTHILIEPETPAPIPSEEPLDLDADLTAATDRALAASGTANADDADPDAPADPVGEALDALPEAWEEGSGRLRAAEAERDASVDWIRQAWRALGVEAPGSRVDLSVALEEIRRLRVADAERDTLSGYLLQIAQALGLPDPEEIEALRAARGRPVAAFRWGNNQLAAVLSLIRDLRTYAQTRPSPSWHINDDGSRFYGIAPVVLAAVEPDADQEGAWRWWVGSRSGATGGPTAQADAEAIARMFLDKA